MTDQSFFEKNFYEKLKEFHKYDSKYFVNFLDNVNMPISKSMHPIIAYNYPEIVYNFIREDDMRNIVRSASIMLHVKRENIQSEEFKESDFETCEVIKNINNKMYSSTEIEEIMSKYFPSKRQRSAFAKSYPQLHDKFETIKDNFDYNMALIAIEQYDKKYVSENIDFIKTYLKDKLIVSCDFCFELLDSSDYTDDDLLQFIYKQELVKFAKSNETVYTFWKHHKSTKYSTINSIELLEKAIEMKIDVDEIEDDFLDENAELVITHYPYFYTYLNQTNLDDPKIRKLALYDPYNVLYFKLDDSNIKHFLNLSNTNISDAYFGIINSRYIIENKKILLEQIQKFEGMFLALQCYPILILLLDDDLYYKHVTPYLINHACKMDKDLFPIFKNREENRWKYLQQ